MLQNIHEKIQGWFAWVIVGIISAVFALFGIQYYLGQGAAGGPVVASVNGGKITQKEYMQAKQRLQQQLRENHRSGQLSSKQLQMLVIDQLVGQRLLLSSAQKEGFQVDQRLVNSYLYAIPAMHENGQFSWGKFRQLAYVNGLSPDEFYQQLANNLTVEQMQIGLGVTSFILPREITKIYNLMHQKRQFYYYKINANATLAKVDVTQQQLSQFYRENSQLFLSPAKVKLDYVVLSPKSLQHLVKVSQQEISNYYQQNQAQFVHPAKYKIDRLFLPVVNSKDSSHTSTVLSNIQKVHTTLLSGMSFNQANKSILKGKALVQNNIWISQTKFDDVVIARLAKLGVNQLSKPIQTSRGYEIVRLVGKTPPTSKSFAEVEGILRKTKQNQKVDALFAKKSEQLSDLSYTNPDSLQPIHKALGLVEHHSDWIVKGDRNQKGILSGDKIQNIVFSDNFIQERTNSNPIELSNGDLVVVRIANYVNQRVKDFNEVKIQINSMVKKQLVDKRIKKLANALASQLKNNVSINPTKYSATKVPMQTIVRNNTTQLSTSMLQKIFSMTLDDSVAVVDQGNESYVVIKLTKIDSNVSMPSSNNVKQLSLQLNKEKNSEIYKLYIDGLRKSAKINIRSIGPSN